MIGDSPFLQAIQQRIQRAWTDAVAMPGEFLLHAEAKDRGFYCVVENVQPNQARIQIAV
jgi:hypothetical protein